MYEDFLIEYKKLKITDEQKTLKEISILINNKIKSLEEDSQVRTYFIWLYELSICGEIYLNLGDSESKGLVNHIEYSNGEKIPDIDSFEKERLDFYKYCEDEVDNLVLKIRLLNYLFDKGIDPYITAKKLCGCLKTYSMSVEYSLKHINIFCRLIDISTKFNLNEYIIYLQDALISMIKKFDEEKKHEYTVGFYELLLRVSVVKRKIIIGEEQLILIIKLLKNAMDYLENKKNYYIWENYAWVLYEWYKETNYDKSDIENLIMKIGAIYERQAISQREDQTISNHIAASYYEKAIQHYIKFGIREKVHSLKVEIKNAYKKGQSELSEQSYSFNYHNLIEKEIEQFITGNMKEDILNFSIFLNESIKSEEYNIMPNINKSFGNAEKRMRDPIWSLISISKIHEGRKIYEGNETLEKTKYLAYDDYDLNLKLTLMVLFDNVWSELISAGMKAEDIMDIIKSWNYLEDKDSLCIERGLERLFEEDYISSIHILTLRFENLFREFFAYGGYATTSIKDKTSQNEQTLNNFLSNDYVRENIPSNFLKLIKFIMVDNLGWNLRNNIAHGIAEIEVFNATTANALLVLYIVFVQYKWVKNEEGDLVVTS